jgi:transcriptional regulator with XRE-family HTH domain
MRPDDFRDWRRRLGWTQADAAAKLGLTVRAIKHYEGGTRGISPVVEKLCRAVGRRSGMFWKGAGGNFRCTQRHQDAAARLPMAP